MISFRYHVVSLVAVLLALAAGVALGAGPLQRDDDLAARVAEEREAAAAARQQVADLAAVAAFDDAFAAVVGPGLVGDSLARRTVTLVLLPGVEESAVTAVASLVGAAGGRVTGTVEVEADLLDPANRQLVEELGQQLESSAPRVAVPTDAGAYERIGALLGHAVATTSREGRPVDAAGDGILAGLSTANLVSVQDEVSRRGNLVLVLAGPPSGDEEQQQGVASIVVSLAESMDRASGGVVVAGPVAAAVPPGVVGAVRDDIGAARAVSSVDVLDRTAGAVVTVLAAAEQARGANGHYGAVDAAGGPLPPTAGTD